MEKIIIVWGRDAGFCKEGGISIALIGTEDSHKFLKFAALHKSMTHISVKSEIN